MGSRLRGNDKVVGGDDKTKRRKLINKQSPSLLLCSQMELPWVPAFAGMTK